MSRDAASQIRVLKETFPLTEQISRAANGTLFRVKHTIEVKPETNYKLTLFVTVPLDFPQSPPYITTSDGEHHVPISKLTERINHEAYGNAFNASSGNSNNNAVSVAMTLPPITRANINSTASNNNNKNDDNNNVPSTTNDININKQEAWNRETNTLSEAVMNAFQRVASWWGEVQPPTIDAALQELNKQSDDLLIDLVNNPNCLDAYSYQLPIVKEIRSATRRTLNKLEEEASKASTLQKDVVRREKEVREMQETLAKEVEQMRQLNNNPLMLSVATPEALLRTLAADVLTLEKDCKACCREVLDLFGKDRRAFQEKLNAYKQLCKRKHILNLKRSQFSAQVAETKAKTK